MQNTSSHCYPVNQFLIRSELPLPCSPDEWVNRPQHIEKLDVLHEPGSAAEISSINWIGSRYGGFLRAYHTADGILVCAGKSLRLRINSDGRLLRFDFNANDLYDQALARALTVNLGISTCGLMRGYLPLHGVGVEIGGNIIGLLASSGTGKSTLLWQLLDAGAKFACDDVIPVYSSEGGMIAVPSISLPCKLSKEALERRGLCADDYDEVLPGEQEFWIPISPEHRSLTPCPLTALFLLQPFTSVAPQSHIFIRRLTEDKIRSLLITHTQGLWAAYSFLDAQHLFSLYSRLLQTVPIYVLEYYRKIDILPDIVRAIYNITHSEI